MDSSNPIMQIDGKNFSVMLYENMLKVEPKKGIVHQLEEALENKPILKDTLGEILHIFAPFHVRLSQIDKASVDQKGNVKLTIRQHRDVTIPLKPMESKKLVDKLNELIPKEKAKELERYLSEQKLRRDIEEEEEMARTPLASGISDIPPTEGVFETEKEAHERIEKEEENTED